MSSTFGVGAGSTGNLGGPDTTQQIQRIFTGRVIGAPAFPGAVTGVIGPAGGGQVVIDGFDTTGQANFTCIGGEGLEPGTAVLVIFPTNGDHTPWIIASDS